MWRAADLEETGSDIWIFATQTSASHTVLWGRSTPGCCGRMMCDLHIDTQTNCSALFISVQKSSKKFKVMELHYFTSPSHIYNKSIWCTVKTSQLYRESCACMQRVSGTNLFIWSYNGFLRTVHTEDSNIITTQKMSLVDLGKLCLYNK